MEKEKEILRAYIGEDIADFIDRANRLRAAGQEVTCEFNGIRFSNMNGPSVWSAYNEARRKASEEIARERAEERKAENKEPRKLIAYVGETIESFLDRAEYLRDCGEEAICEVCDIKFNNMDGNSAWNAYRKAQIDHDVKVMRQREINEPEEVQKREKELRTAIMNLPDNAMGYSLEELVDIISHINSVALGHEPAIDLPQDLCAKLGNFLMTAGYAPIAEEMKLQNPGLYNLYASLPPNPVGKKPVYLDFRSKCIIYVPEEVDLKDMEQLKNYSIGNFLAQLQTGKLDEANLDLFYNLSYKIQQQKAANQVGQR